ncbi:hypothetical protein ANABIO32_39550 [Rossellomorea marisflavi]|nr:hypothetical protein ANABIO32_39550 [Rossellomorea marisflavi]
MAMRRFFYSLVYLAAASALYYYVSQARDLQESGSFLGILLRICSVGLMVLSGYVLPTLWFRKGKRRQDRPYKGI